MKLKYLLPLIILNMFSSCSPTKFVPEGDYLLDRVEIKSNNKDVYSDELYEYLRQNSNSYVFGLFRMQLGIYNLAGRDSSKWVNRTLKKNRPGSGYSRSCSHIYICQTNTALLYQQGVYECTGRC
jgi:hypothetical protein